MGMEKGKISRIFAGETLCIGVLSLICGLIFGVLLSQGLSLLSLKLFAVNLEEFQIIFSIDALKMTIKCFVIIFLVVVIFNVSTISKVKLIDLFTASRKMKKDLFRIKYGRELFSHLQLLVLEYQVGYSINMVYCQVKRTQGFR